MQGLTREQWDEKLAAIGAYIESKGSKGTIELIGSWPVMEAGLPGRTSMDLDVWEPNSRFDRTLFREACLHAGLAFNPIDEVEGPYVQLVKPGIVQVPKHEPEEAGSFGGLNVATPPPAALIASKLVRGANKDVQDVVFLMHKCGVPIEDVKAFVDTIGNKMARTTAQENMVYLSFSDPAMESSPAPGQGQAIVRVASLSSPTAKPRAADGGGVSSPGTPPPDV